MYTTLKKKFGIQYLYCKSIRHKKSPFISFKVKTNCIKILTLCCFALQELAGQGASAQEWLGCVQKFLGGNMDTPPDKNPKLVANFRSPKLKPPHLQEKLQEALEASNKYIKKFLVFSEGS